MDEIKVTVIKCPDRKNFVLKYVDPVTGQQKYASAKTNIPAMRHWPLQRSVN